MGLLFQNFHNGTKLYSANIVPDSPLLFSMNVILYEGDKNIPEFQKQKGALSAWNGLSMVLPKAVLCDLWPQRPKWEIAEKVSLDV